MGKATKRREPVSENAPTPEQMLAAAFIRAGKAYRRLPPIDVMLADGRLSDDQHKALSHYRNTFNAATKSPTRDSCDFSPRGGGDGPSASMLRAKSELRWLDRELGRLQPITKYIAGDDNSLSQWAIEKYGAKQRFNRKPDATEKGLKEALTDIRYAAGAIKAAVEAGRRW